MKSSVHEIWRRLRDGQPLIPPVAARFLELFQAHGIAPVQIQRFLPQITLDRLAPDRLEAALTNETLEQASFLFDVRREWLEGITGQMYEPLYCYKAPHRFFENLAGWRIRPQTFAVHALCCSELDNASPREQPVALVVVERIDRLGDEEICRYRVYHDEWDWAHPACRLQLKAVARLFHLGWQTPVPLHRVQRRVLEAVRSGRRVPRAELQGCLLTEPSLEDFASGNEENGKAVETEEMASVQQYIEHHRLTDFLPGTEAEPT